MNDKLITSTVSIALGIVALAGLAVLLSKQAQTGNVIVALGQAITCAIGTAVYPITGVKPNCSTGFTSSSTITFG